MRISTKGRYALRLLVDLAEHLGSGFIPLKDVSERQGISKKYLEQIIPIMNNGNILKAERGAQGGYMLAKTPDKITVAEILRLTEGSLAPVDCVDIGSAACERSAFCATLPVWQGLARVIDEYLSSITLQDILDQQAQRGQDYVI